MSINTNRLHEIQIIPSVPGGQLASPITNIGNMFDTRWIEFFDRDQARAVVSAHLDILPSTATKERHTHRLYNSGLDYFIKYLGDVLPTPDVIEMYLAHLKMRPGVKEGERMKSSTIASKYIASLRHYLNALANQAINLTDLSDRDFRYVIQCKEQIRAVLAMKTPPVEHSSNRPALEQHGQRLKWSQVLTILDAIDYSTIKGKRDYAILYIGFTCGLRVAEIQRMTQDCVRMGDTCYEIHVRGKRQNSDPVPADASVPLLIQTYVDAYNAPLSPDDPRRITPDSPLWRPLTRSSSHFKIGRLMGTTKEGQQIRCTADHAMQASGLRYVVRRRSKDALGFSIGPHDMRRSLAAIMRNENMGYDVIQTILRHKSIATTQKYVGKPQNLAQCLITNRLSIDLPTNGAKQESLL